MPSFFKNIKKLFSKPAKKSQSRPISTTAKKSSSQHSTERAPKTSSFMDAARAEKINATIIAESTHHITFRDIDNNAVKIVKDLQRANYESYLVGGCVRDLLLNKRPKDFDVTTGAHPEQAHKVFNRSRLIGRRFKLLHVRFGRDLIEVATFRASHSEQAEKNHAKQADTGMILRDNVYGTIEQDAMRRDFTINALYYDINNRSIYDFTNGYQDIADGKIRMIGDPSERYREDPVRMLRAIRFAAKLGFSIEENTAKPIKELAPMLFDIAPARLFDEVLKLLQSGHGNDSLVLLREYKLLETILPQTAFTLDQNIENANKLISNALENTDRRLKQRKSVSPGFLFAVLLWPAVQNQLNQLLANKRIPPLTALTEAASKVISEQVKRTSIPKRFSTNIREIWELQFRLIRQPSVKAYQLVEHPRFRAAYDLLVLREKSGEDLDNMGTWWTEFQSASADDRENLINTKSQKKSKPKKKKPAVKHSSEKAVFEKFDVVEQVKATSKVRPKTPNKKAVPQETVSDTPIIVKPITKAAIINEATIGQNIINEATFSQTIINKTTQPSSEQQTIADVPSTEAKIKTQNQAPAKPSVTQATAVTIDPPASIEKKDSLVMASSAIAEAKPVRKKSRRSRAKNDPRNK